MNKSNQQIPVCVDTTNGVSDTRNSALSGKRKFLRLTWVVALCLSIAGLITLSLFSDKTTWIDSNGFLHEPLFGLIPISFFLFFVAIVLAVLDVALKFWKRS